MSRAKLCRPVIYTANYPPRETRMFLRLFLCVAALFIGSELAAGKAQKQTKKDSGTLAPNFVAVGPSDPKPTPAIQGDSPKAEPAQPEPARPEPKHCRFLTCD